MKMLPRFAGAVAVSLASTILLAGSVFASTAGSMHKPAWVAHPPIHIKNGATATYQNGYTPSDIRGAYGLSQLANNGSGTTIAIIDAYGSTTIVNDLNTFDNQFGLPPADLTVVSLGHRSDKGWALETSLDVEWVHALAPAAKIMLVEAKSASLSDLLSAVDYASSHGAQVVSMSWGGNEFSGESSYDNHFNTSGVVYSASSGDNGAGVSWPAVSPNVLSVGGTTLNIDSSGNYLSETAWSGSGGGISSYEGVPSYQNFLGLSGRGVPDVAFDADPSSGVAVYDSTSYNGQSGWFVVGGTSFGAPAWAAIVADVDQDLTGTNQAYDSMELLNALYGDMQSNYGYYFYDITTGSNGNAATSGYDIVTGIGSPQAFNLLPELSTQGSANSTVATSSGGGGGGTTSSGGHGHGKK